MYFSFPRHCYAAYTHYYTITLHFNPEVLQRFFVVIVLHFKLVFLLTGIIV